MGKCHKGTAMIQETVQSWFDAGKSKEANGYIHPAGNISEDEYWASGRDDALIVQQKIGNADSVLEFGCGNGRILKNLCYREIYGVDISPELVKGLDSACLVSEFSKTVDAVFSLSVFIHLKRHEAIEALQWIYDHLNPGGKAYLQIPIYDTDREPESFIDVGVWSRDTFVDCVSRIGFKIMEINASNGAFSFEAIGSNHNQFQVLSK
jgi:SAM-dependent methyltransferase